MHLLYIQEPVKNPPKPFQEVARPQDFPLNSRKPQICFLGVTKVSSGAPYLLGIQPDPHAHEPLSFPILFLKIPENLRFASVMWDVCLATIVQIPDPGTTFITPL